MLFFPRLTFLRNSACNVLTRSWAAGFSIPTNLSSVFFQRQFLSLYTASWHLEFHHGSLFPEFWTLGVFKITLWWMALSITDVDISKSSLQASECIGNFFASVSLVAIISVWACKTLVNTLSSIFLNWDLRTWDPARSNMP